MFKCLTAGKYIRMRMHLFSQSAVFLTDLMQKKLTFFGVNFILQKFCPCKKMTNIRYGPNGVIFPPFHSNSNIFASTQTFKHTENIFL